MARRALVRGAALAVWWSETVEVMTWALVL
jgi:hypothetical protein